ncbi:hypothetical protein D9613_009829 [Agrocybe pediades]|uniref:Fe2OG dioxygenase domain-containing protein n=1 Tax=Agrocybe pediades TaxID=84607 RepID=A0A8H4QYB3_9AGAR|nr:hypothetical protein D9613_009829 [Agrocybe pediades]
MSTATPGLQIPAWAVPLLNFKQALNKLQELQYCTGTVPLNPESSKLFYEGPNTVRVIDFMNVTEEDLSRLSLACQPASFGRDQQDVYDETYRKAGKLDATHFVTALNPWASGIVDTVNQVLLGNRDAGKSIKAELYNLNVYGPGSFFKSHVDTPHGDNMFGSLVIVLPTKHEGGSLVFRHEGQESVFDTAATVSSERTPHAAFVAFFSDVEHEVLEVKSGYRVTLTYNLYFVDPPKPPANLGVVPAEGDPMLNLKSKLLKLLEIPTMLPQGGLFAFRLKHKYPITPSSTIISEVASRLKGTDVMLKEMCEELSLDTSIKLMYLIEPELSDSKLLCLLDCYVDGLEDLDQVEDIKQELLAITQGQCTITYLYPGRRRERGAIPLVLLQGSKSAVEGNMFTTKYMAYGNEARVDTIYNDIYLVAKVKPFKDRGFSDSEAETAEEPEEATAEEDLDEESENDTEEE